MKYKSVIRIKNAIIVTEQVLRELQVELEKGFCTFKYKASLMNADIVEFDTVDEVINYNNALDFKIKSLEITAFDEKSNMCFIDIKENRYGITKFSTTVYISFETESQEFVEVFKSKANLLFKRNEQSRIYTLIAKYSSWHTALFMLGLSLGMNGVIFITNGKLESSKIDLNFITYVYIVIIVFFVYYCIGKARDSLFPAVVFYLGDEREKEAKRKTYRSIIFTVIILGVIVGVISGLITNYLTK